MTKELLNNMIFKSQNGSKLYGTDTPQSDDDYMGIFVEPPEFLFSLNKAATINLHDRGPEEKNYNADVDGIAYPLRHFLKLATDGNPSILCIFFAKDEHIVFTTEQGELLLKNKEYFVSQKAGPKFLGYMTSQYLRLKGEKKGHMPSREEIRAKYGYDTKFAMQLLRLGLQGQEFLLNGNIELPVAPQIRRYLMDVRNGKFNYDEILEQAESVMKDLEYLVKEKKLDIPEEPEYVKITQMSREIHESFWEWQNSQQ